MKHALTLLACMSLLSGSVGASEQQPSGLEALRWQYRVILVFAPEPHASNAVSRLGEFTDGIEERDIAWFVLNEEALQTNIDGQHPDDLREHLMSRYFAPVPTGTVVLLIGKDGTVKSRSSDLDLQATFGQIDRMPMRRAEMRAKDSESG